MKEDSLKKRYSIKLFANILSGIIGAVLVAIVPKALGPIAYGEFTYIQQFFIKLIGFLDMGSSMAFFTKLSANHTRKELLGFYAFYSLFVLILIFSFIIVIDTLGLMSFFLPNIGHKYIYLGILFGFFTWVTQTFIKISDAYALTVSVELIKIAHKIISLLILVGFIYLLAFDLELYFYFNYISLLSFLIILAWLYSKKNIFSKKMLVFDFAELKILLKEFFEYCHPLFIYSAIGILAGMFDIWLIQLVAGSEQTGFYGLSYSIAAMCFLFTSAMTPIITREFSKSYQEKNFDKMRKLFYRYIPMLYSIAAFFAVFVSLQSENILDIFTDEKFADAHFVLVIMALYPIHQTYGQLSGSIFYATGQTKLLRNLALVVQPLGMIISLIMIKFLDLGAMGLAYKMLIEQLIAVNVQLYFNVKFLKISMKYFVLHQIYSVLILAFIAWMASNAVSFSSPLLEFLISGVIYTFLVIIMAYIFPQVFALSKDEIKSNLAKVRKNVIKK